MNNLKRKLYTFKYIPFRKHYLSKRKTNDVYYDHIDEKIVFNYGMSDIDVKDINEYDRILKCIDLVHKQYPRYSVNEILNILRLDLYITYMKLKVRNDVIYKLRNNECYLITDKGTGKSYIYYYNIVIDNCYHIYYYNKEYKDFSLFNAIDLTFYKGIESINYNIVEYGKPGIDLLVYCYDRLKELFDVSEKKLKKLDKERKEEETNREYKKFKEHWIDTHPNRYSERDNFGNVIDE